MDLKSIQYGFESHRDYTAVRSLVAKALVLHTSYRRFESYRTDKICLCDLCKLAQLTVLETEFLWVRIPPEVLNFTITKNNIFIVMKKLLLLLLVLCVVSCASKKPTCDAYGLNNQKNIEKNLDSTKINIIFTKD